MRRFVTVAAVLLAAVTALADERPRIRDLGLEPGILPTGPHNAITDVDGVRVGQTTLVHGDAVRTGVTAILPHGGDLFRQRVPAAIYVGNGFGKAAGFLQVEELGNIETPIVLTNTLSVGRAIEAVVAWTLARPGNEEVGSVNAIVGETNDGWLNDIRGMHVGREDVIRAIESATGGAVAEGNVGAGTGTRALGFKGGIGTASRLLPEPLGGYTVGALVQTNYGGVLTIAGVPVGVELGRYPFREALESADADDGSCMIVLATDAPVSPRNLERMARRAVLGLARTGGFMSNGSGDFVVAFSTRNRVPRNGGLLHSIDDLDNAAMTPLFLATVEAVEEAVYNSLLRAETMVGRDGHTQEALPIDRLVPILRRYGRLPDGG